MRNFERGGVFGSPAEPTFAKPPNPPSAAPASTDSLKSGVGQSAEDMEKNSQKINMLMRDFAKKTGALLTSSGSSGIKAYDITLPGGKRWCLKVNLRVGPDSAALFDATGIDHGYGSCGAQVKQGRLAELLKEIEPSRFTNFLGRLGII